MNHLIRILRLTVCLYLGFVSIAAWADARDDSMDAMEVYQHQITEAEARTRKANRDAAELAAQASLEAAKSSQAALIEKAWSCDPVLNENVKNWKLRETKVNGALETDKEGRTRYFKEILKFRGCSDSDANDQVRAAFIEKYVCGLKSSNYPINVVYVEMNGGKDELNQFEDAIISGVALCAHSTGEYVYKADSRRHDVQRHQSQLKSGAVSISSFNDAVLLHEPKNLAEVMISPLLKPDSAQYAAAVTIEGEEGDFLRVKTAVRNIFGGRVDIAYADLRLTKKTTNYSQSGMRIGGVIKVFGRYVQNKKYKTLTGEGKTMPVIEVMYIGD